MSGSHGEHFVWVFSRVCLSVCDWRGTQCVDQGVSSLWHPPASTSQGIAVRAITPGVLVCFSMKGNWCTPEGQDPGDPKDPTCALAQLTASFLFIFF